jgi:uncharacterized protein YbjQ (UPF0145 family)
MSKIECARCKMKVEESKTEVIEYVRYCKKCANEKKNNDKKVKEMAKEEEKYKIKEREYIERELEGITEEDIKFIIVTTTDNVEVKRIGEYINVISVQEYKYNKNFDENEKDVAEKDNRECMERALFKIKRQAYLLGADAIVGMKVYSNFDYDTKQGVVSSIMTKANITGTAVRLIQ